MAAVLAVATYRWGKIMIKNTVRLAVAIVALGASATAATIQLNCATFPLTFAGGAGSGTASCGGFNSALGTLTGATLNLLADYEFGAGASNDIRMSFTIGAPAGVTWASSLVVVDVTGGFNSTTFVPPVPVSDNATGGISNANFASAFNVGVSSAVVTGGAATSSGGVQVTYTYTAAATISPEPGTTALLASGLIGLALLGRKRVIGR